MTRDLHPIGARGVSGKRVSPVARRRAWWVPLPPRREAPARRSRGVVVALALLAGYLLFCHGCHGDEDNELFARLWDGLTGRVLSPSE